uniref:Folylpolyglutamate synthase n=1 Tax=Zosterops lateralis melanops TaxID=1220523 RepID=A0A8D2NMQ9_ZOSLA
MSLKEDIYKDAVRMLNTLQTNASYLEQVKRERGDPQAQLEAMQGFLERSGLKVEDLDRLNIIHVTGTKGKGSACAFTECILRGYGLKTGFYSSPHLVQVRERIRINGQPISKDLFNKYFWLVYNRLEETKDPAHASMPAYFRFLTIMAFHVFLQEKVDLAVVEVGIGGTYDCTNIIRAPVVCGVSSLGIDHTSILGDTMEKIAWQKGGIFKPGVPAFTVAQPERPLEVLRERAQERKVSCWWGCGWGVSHGGVLSLLSPQCPLYLCPELDEFEEGSRPLELGLAGAHQRSNAALALQLAQMWLQRRGCHGKAGGQGQEARLHQGPRGLSGMPVLPRSRGAEGGTAKHRADGEVSATGACLPTDRCHDPRPAGHRVAGPDSGALPRPCDVVPGWGSHHQQHPGLCPLVPPGRPQPGEAPRVRTRCKGGHTLQGCGGAGAGGPLGAWATLPFLPAVVLRCVCCSSMPQATGTRRRCSSCWW